MFSLNSLNQEMNWIMQRTTQILVTYHQTVFSKIQSKTISLTPSPSFQKHGCSVLFWKEFKMGPLTVTHYPLSKKASKNHLMKPLHYTSKICKRQNLHLQRNTRQRKKTNERPKEQKALKVWSSLPMSRFCLWHSILQKKGVKQRKKTTCLSSTGKTWVKHCRTIWKRI